MPFYRSNGGAAALSKAETQVGVPYIFGGETPGVGFDCSGLAQWSYGFVGVALSRTTFAQYLQYQIALAAARAVGDLLFFEGSDPGPNGEPGHVGIHAGYGAVSADQHAFIPEAGGVEVMFNAPFTNDPGGIRFDYVSFAGPVLYVTRPALALPLAPPAPPKPPTEEEMVVLVTDPINNGTAILDLSTGKYYGLSNPAMLSYYESCGVKHAPTPTKAVWNQFTQSGTI